MNWGVDDESGDLGMLGDLRHDNTSSIVDLKLQPFTLKILSANKALSG
jgi:hypothetical protein